MGILRKVYLFFRAISLIVFLTFTLSPCFSQNLTTRAPYGMGMTEDYNYYIFFENNIGRISLAAASANDKIFVCPYIVHTQNKALFKAVTGYEIGHHLNFVSHGEIKADTLKQKIYNKLIIDSAYWNASLDLSKIIYKGHDGSSIEKAIIIKKANTMKIGIVAEYAYLEKALGKRGAVWKPLRQFLLLCSNKYYDVIEVENINTSEIKYYWFDITKYFGKF